MDIRPEQSFDRINTCSRPSDLKITDMRFTDIVGAPMHCTLLKLYTNQGLVGLGEVRDAGSRTYAAMLKNRLLGENPCDIDRLFRRIKQFGGPGRQAGGVCGVEVALWDLAGKAYGVPVYQMLGGRFRDRVRIYCDTDVNSKHTGADMGRALRVRMDMGFTFLKMDLGLGILREEPGTLTGAAHPSTGFQVTEKGLDLLEEYVAGVRAVIGYDIPLAIDHFGPLNVEDCVRLCRRLEKYSIAWAEDMIPWHLTGQYALLRRSTTVPVCTGEDIYLKENFRPLLEAGGVSVIHPDILSSGGILENKKIGDMAQDYGVAMALHMAETPVAAMAAVHSAAATENFLVCENHSVDVPWWDDLAVGTPKKIVENGFIEVPDKPGLGIDDLNDEVLAEHLHPDFPELWAPTGQWDRERSYDRLWS